MSDRRMRGIRRFSVVVLALAACATASAQIVEYELANANAGTAPTVTTTKHPAGVRVSPLAAVGTSGPLEYPRTLFYSSWPTAGSGLDRGQYFEFTVTPEAGHTVTYRSITLSLASGGHGDPAVEIRASTDGFTESDRLLRATHYTANTTFQTLSGLDIAALGSQNGPVTFRVYLEKGSSGFAGLLDTDAFGGGTSVIVDGNVVANAE